MSDYENEVCFICGKPDADSVDHIPPKNIFLSKYRSLDNLITVPAHHECNQHYQKDDEYFRFFLTIPGYWKSELARELWDEKVIRQVLRERSAGFKKYIAKHTTSMDLGEENLSVFLADTDRVKKEVERIARGLFYHKTKNILPLNFNISVDLMQPVIREKRKKLESRGEFTSKVNGIFKYYWNHSDDIPFGHMWLAFFDCVDFWILEESQ